MHSSSKTPQTKIPQWRLQKGLDRRFKSGHPWVYSNEIQGKPGGIAPGEIVELQDSGGQFLARGYGNPHSLIAFRALTRNPECLDPLSFERILSLLERAGRLREQAGFSEVSHRLCFGEADFIPGLVIDRYLTEKAQVFVVQAHTSGAQKILPDLNTLLEAWVRKVNLPAWKSNLSPSERWDQTAIVIRNDLSVRVLEGLSEEEPLVLKETSHVKLKEADIWVKSASHGAPLSFRVDLLAGQKTGFFLDQFSNIELALLRLKSQLVSQPLTRKLKILDLCSYVGQWGTQFSQMLSQGGFSAQVTLVDRSASALEMALLNVSRAQGTPHGIRADVLKDLGQLEDQSFDCVISDPPALIQNRKSIPAGSHAYLQLATQAFRLVKKGGAIVCCSCSALLEEEVFFGILTKASLRNKRQTQWLGRGGLSPDHPALSEFPEGRYLKASIGISTELP